MKKIYSLLIIVLLNYTVFAQEQLKKEDLSLPTENSYSVQGFGNVLNESTGKVTLSYPVASILARGVSYNVAFGYDGTNVFKQATYTARHMATGILGVGWNMSFPRIVADTKLSASRDDDTYILNGMELACVSRSYSTALGAKIWQFKTVSPTANIIKYYEVANTLGTPQVLDYWEVTDDKGYIYTYGYDDNSRESVLAWGNWIGDGKGTGGAKHTAAWNLSSIKDQYNNSISFSYLKVEQGYTTTSQKHTEAAYLQQITSSTGEKIVFEYATKSPSEYYEPHIEAVEPDAYQERYEKNYLNSVKSYNSSNELIANFELAYNVINSSVSEKAKRFLTGVTIKNSSGNYLPPTTFEYYTDGDFTGAIKKWTKPEGGSISYNYSKNPVFTNNSYGGTGGWATYCADKYNLRLDCSNPQVSNSTDTGDVFWADGSFFVTMSSWTGRTWKAQQYNIPATIRYSYTSGGIYRLDNAKFVYGNDYWGVLVFDRSTHKGSLYLNHLKKDGTWHSYQLTNLSTDGSSGNTGDDPALINGDDFVGVGVRYSGDLFTFVWNGTTWQYKNISQGSGGYYYAAQNNFILSLNTYTGTDMAVTLGTANTGSYGDRYYIHFLDAEKKWQTRSWSAIMASMVANISTESHFYPCNSMASFVAGNNPEFFLRWESDYRLLAGKIDNIVGEFNDAYPLFPLFNNIYSCQHMNDPDNGYCYSFKQLGYTGSSWVINNSEIWSNNGFGQNRFAGNNNGAKIFSFDPNTSSWGVTSATNATPDYYVSDQDSFSFGNEVFLAGDHVYRINNWGFEQLITLNPYLSVQEFANTGGDYVYVNSSHLGDDTEDYDGDGDTTDSNVGNASYYYVDKTTNELKTVVFSASTNISYLNRRARQFSGQYPFFSRTNIRGRKLIDNLNGQQIYDIVLTEVITDDDNGNVTKIKYAYGTGSQTLPDDITVIYDNITITQAGFDTGTTNGYTKKYFDTGINDLTKAGVVIKTETYNSSNVKVGESTFNYTKNLNYVYNSASNLIATGYKWVLLSKIENSYYGALMSTTTNYLYDTYGNLTYSDKVNSQGLTESTSLTYADSNFSFVQAKNMRGMVYRQVNKVGSDIVSVVQTNWVQDAGKVYSSGSSSGTSDATLRVNNVIEKVDDYGNIVQTSNGLGISKSILMGYNYKYTVATINNATQDDVINALEVSYATLQTYSASQLKTELLKLYNNFPMLSLTLYDNFGRKILEVDSRKNETNYSYDEFGRLKYITDKNGYILKTFKYNFKN